MSHVTPSHSTQGATNSVPTHHEGAQAAHLRRYAADAAPAAERPEPRTVVVFGAKGGVGVTAATLAIARDLATSKRGRGTTLVVDAHLGRDDIGVLARAAELPDGVMLTTAVKLGVEPARVAAVPDKAARLLFSAAGGWTRTDDDCVVIDAGVADTAWAVQLATRAARPLLVTTPDPLARVNAYRALKQVGPAVERVGVLVNHAGNAQLAGAGFDELAASAARFLPATPTLAGWMPTSSSDPTHERVHLAA